ncbi:MAG: hypothetical protein ACOZCL_12755 [Bacillota bacterium]
MLSEKIWNNKGSTLVMLMMYIAILSILGMTLISVAFVNYNTKHRESKSKYNFYLAESGLDEACVRVGEAVEYVMDYIDDNSDTLISAPVADYLEDYKYIDSDFDGEEELNTTFYYTADAGSDLVGMLKQDKVEELIQVYYDKVFKEQFNSYYGTLSAQLTNPNYYGAIDFEGIKPTVAITAVKQYIVNPLDMDDILQPAAPEDNEFNLSLEATYQKNGIDKKLAIDITVTIPEYNAAFYVNNQVSELYNNALWSKVLAANGNIYITSDNAAADGTDTVTVNGDIYAYANDARDNGGIYVGYNGIKGNLTVNGNIYTAGNIQTRAENSEINIGSAGSPSEVYCNSLQINELHSPPAHPTQGEYCNITMYGDLNTLDDLELNGDRSSITLNGNYYGFTYVSDTSNASSSIVINSDDVSSSNPTGSTGVSKLRITGTGGLGAKSYYPSEGIFVGGTVYVTLYNSKEYQTGESVAIKGNYRAYTKELTGITDVPGGNIEENLLNVENMQFEYWDPLYLATKFNIGGTGDETDSNNNTFDYNEYRAAYFEYARAQYPDFIKVSGTHEIDGNDIYNIDIDNVVYTSGAYIDGTTIDYAFIDVINQKLRFDQNLREYNYYVKQLADPQINDYLSTNYSAKRDFTRWFSYGTNIIPASNVIGDEFFYFNNSTTDTLVIEGPDAENITGTNEYTVSDPGGVFQGIIYTRGNVKIAGKIDFKGTIIAEGNIEIIDENQKTFTNDYAGGSLAINTGSYVVKKVLEHKRDTYTVNIGDYFVTDSSLISGLSSPANDSIAAAISTDAGIDSSISTYYNKYSNYVKINRWKYVR